MVTRRFVGVAPPPRQVEPIYPIINVRPGQVYDLTLLADAPWGLFVHWDKTAGKGQGASILCMGRRHGCIYCGKLARTWVGYEAVGDMNKRVLRALCFGASGMAALENLAGSNGLLRGMRVNVERYSSSPRSHLCFRASSDRAPSPLPDCPDLGATIRNLFGVAALPPYVAGEGVHPDDDNDGGAL